MAEDALPDQIVGGRYRLVEKLGSGGFGHVWRARDEALHVDVAAKEVWLPPAISAAERAERLTRAEREARNAAQLRDHANIVAVHDVVIEDDVPWIVMRLVAGQSLQERIASGGPLPPLEAAKIAVAVLNALAAAHAADIVHRDIKPANVLLDNGGDVLLTDFGIAVHHADTAITHTGNLIGSVEYMAPERLRGNDGQAASDLFSLGATLYQAVEGISPFRRDTPTASLTAILFDEVPPPQHAGALATLITMLLAKDPAARPTIPQALALIDVPPPVQDTTTRTLTRGLTSPPITVVAPRGPRVSPRRAVAIVAAATVIVAGVVAGVLVGNRGSGSSTPPASVNLALVDTGLTDATKAEISADFSKVFSYDYRNPNAAEQAANTLVTAQQRPHVNQIMGQVRAQGQARKLVTTVTVTDAAVADLTQDTASVLIFATETSTQPGDTPATSGAVVLVSAVRSDGHWLITDVNTDLNQPRPNLPPSGPDPRAIQRDQALNAAGHAADVLTTADYRNAQASLDAWLGVTTGALHDQLSNGQASFVATFQSDKSITQGSSAAAAVLRLDATAGTATVLIAEHVQVQTVGSNPSDKQLRLILEMSRTPAGWRANSSTTAPTST